MDNHNNMWPDIKMENHHNMWPDIKMVNHYRWPDIKMENHNNMWQEINGKTTVKSFLFGEHLILCFSWEGQSTNLRFQRHIYSLY